jgi:hypothetical protein
MTIEELRMKYAPDKHVRTFQIRWQKAENTDYDGGREATAEEVARIADYHKRMAKRVVPEQPEIKNGKIYPAKIAGEITPTPEIRPAKKKGEKKPEAPEISRFDLALFLSQFRSAILICAVLLHAALIWYDVAQIAGTPGHFAGALLFLLAFCAVLFASDTSMPRTSEAAMWVVAAVDAFAWFVHVPVFEREILARGYGVGDLKTGVIAGVVCAASWLALYLYRDSKQT